MTGIADSNLRQLMTNLIIELYKYQAESERKRIIERQQQGIDLAKEQNSKANIMVASLNTLKMILICNMRLNFIKPVWVTLMWPEIRVLNELPLLDILKNTKSNEIINKKWTNSMLGYLPPSFRFTPIDVPKCIIFCGKLNN